MSRSSDLEDRAFAEAKRLCYAGLDASTLLREVVRRLRVAASFEACCATTIDPASGLIAHALVEEMGGEEWHRLFFEHIYFEEEVDKQRRMIRDRHPVLLLSEETGGKLGRTLRYRELTGSLGLGYELRGVFTVNGNLWGSINLSREQGRPDFDTREVALIRWVTPHLATGLKAAVLRSQALLERDDDDTPGVLTLDHRGRVAQYTPAAERWLRELGDLEPGWREGKELPPAIWMVVGALKRSLKPENERDQHGAPHICVRARSGRWLALHGARTEPRPDDRGSETMIVIEPARPREVAWLRTSAYGLSDREREVVDLVVRGASTKEISQALYISEYTVQEHLSNVFDKVGVRGWRALVKRLYLDNAFSESHE